MSIEVMTHDETFDIRRGTWFHSEQGVLVVSDDKSTVALFAPGEWVGAIKRESTTMAEPRVWNRIVDIPEGVVTKDRQGYFWKTKSGLSSMSTDAERWGSFRNATPDEDKYGPFIEVLDK